MPNPRQKDTRTPNDRTLRDLVEENLALFFECGACFKNSQVDLLDLIWRVGPETRVETVRFKAVCGRCGKRRATPLLCNFSKHDSTKWFPQPPKNRR